MPAERKGFFFRHFEKVTCAVVVVAIIVALLYMSKRSRGQEVTDASKKINEALIKIRGQQQKPPPPVELPDYRKEWAAASEVSAAADITREAFWYPWPVIYPLHEMGTGQPYILTFIAPLSYGSVKVEDEQPLRGVIDRIEHPAEGSWAKVKVYTKDKGTAKIVGIAGRRKHIRPILVDPNIQPPAKPPLNLKAEAQRDGVLLTFEANPENKETIGVTHYEVWRKLESDLVGEFVQVGMVTSTEKTTVLPGGMAPGAGMPGGMPGMPGMPAAPGAGGGAAAGGTTRRTGTAEPTAVTYSFRDALTPSESGAVTRDPRLVLRPDEGYVYKVRTVAKYAYNKVSEFSAEAQVRTWPTVDFQFLGVAGRKLRFEVAVLNQTTGAVRRAEFRNEIGEEIGGEITEQMTGVTMSFLTRCYVLDVQQGVRRAEGGPPVDHRVIYVNKQGEVDARWRKEVRAPYLWTDKRPAGPEVPGIHGPGARPGMPGPGMPPGGIPEFLTPNNP